MYQRAEPIGSPNAQDAHHSGESPVCRASMRPPQQVLSVQPTLPVILTSPAPSVPVKRGVKRVVRKVLKKVVASPNVQMSKPFFLIESCSGSLNRPGRVFFVPSQVSPASKGFVQKGGSGSEAVRSKLSENLSDAVFVDSDQQIAQKSSGNISVFRSACQNKNADGGTLHKPSTCITLNEGKDDTGTASESVGSISEQHDTLSGGILRSDTAIKVSKDAQEQSIHVCLDNDVSGNNTVASDESLQRHGFLYAPGESPVCRASLMPLPQESVQPTSLVIRTSPAPSVPVKRAIKRVVKKVLKKVVASPNVQALKLVPSQVSPASKGFVEKGPLLKTHPQSSDSETVRSKFRENLGGALCVDSDQEIVQKSVGDDSPFRSACEDKCADGGTLHRPSTCITLNEGKADTGTGPKSVGSISEQHDTLTGGILGSDTAIKASKDAQEQSIHVCLENDVSGNNTVASDEFLQHHGPVCAPEIIVGASESISLLNSKRSTPSDGTTVHLNEPEFKRAKTSDGVTWEQKGALSVDSNQQIVQKSAGNISPFRSACEDKYADGGTLHKPSTCITLNEGEVDTGTGSKSVGSISEQHDTLIGGILGSDTAIKASKDAQEQSIHVCLENDVSGNNTVASDEFLQRHGPVCAPDIVVGTSESISLLNSKRSTPFGTDDGTTVPLNEPEFKRAETSDGVTWEQKGTVLKGQKGQSLAPRIEEDLLSNLECVANKKIAFIQGKVHDMKYTENLPEIITLDDSVEAPDSNLPLECHSTETAQDDPNFTDRATHTLKPLKNHRGEGNAAASVFEFTYVAPSPQDNCQAGIRSPKNGSIHILSPAKQPEGDLLIKKFPEKMDTEIPDTECAMLSKAIYLWEGTIQFKLSSFITVVAIFKSGEKPSTNEWCRFVEIKGRVKLTDLQDFLELLPNSMSRAVTVTELRWKEGSHESGRQQFMQTIDSYIADERVGLVHLAEGVELYICPNQGKNAQVLVEHLPKEHSGILTVTRGVPVIGVFVWQRPHVYTQTPTWPEGSEVQPMPISRKQQAGIATSVLMSAQPTRPDSQFVHPNEHRCLENDATDDIPPGFGRRVAKDDNDLPAYDCARISNRPLYPNEAMPYSYRRQQHGQAHSPPPMDLVRQLVHKYGTMDDSAEPWDRSHDDLPEGDPSLSGRRYNAMRQQPVLPSPLSQVYTLPQEHARAVQWPWNHRAEAPSVQPGWRQSRPQQPVMPRPLPQVCTLPQEHARAVQWPWNHRAEAPSVQPGWRQSRPQWQGILHPPRLVVELDLAVPRLTALRLRGAR